jgi:hypothetical protein
MMTPVSLMACAGYRAHDMVRPGAGLQPEKSIAERCETDPYVSHVSNIARFDKFLLSTQIV